MNRDIRVSGASGVSGDDVGGITRRRVRDEFADGKILVRIVKDLQNLLSIDPSDQISAEPLQLWDNKKGTVAYGINYSEDK